MFHRRRGLITVLSSALVIGAFLIPVAATGQAQEPQEPVDDGLDVSDAARYEDAIFTGTTPAEVVRALTDKIEEVEAEAADGDPSEVAAAHDTVAYLAALVELVCEQEASARC
jgi:hypothetical protein